MLSFTSTYECVIWVFTFVTKETKHTNRLNVEQTLGCALHNPNE
jgi:hypothetical protein